MADATPDVRILHDGSFIRPGGAGRVARTLAEVFDAPVTVGHTVAPSFWDGVDASFPFQSRFHAGVSGWLWDRLPKPYAEFRVGQLFGELTFDETVLISTSVYSKWIVPRHDQYHLHYANAHPVHFYSQADAGVLGWYKRLGKATADRQYTDFCDALIANSEFTKQRMVKHYGRTPTVLHPPIRIDAFDHREPADPPYLAMIGRLVQSKRVLMVARACQNTGIALRVIGDGPLRERLDAMENVSVIRNATDDEVEAVLAECLGGIAFGEREHCGMTPKEFQAAGKPVIVPDEPNLRNHVSDGETGIIVPVSVDGIENGIERLLGSTWEPAAIQSATSKWGREQFADRARDIVATAIDTAPTDTASSGRGDNGSSA